jgi:hypothetical protein
MNFSSRFSRALFWDINENEIDNTIAHSKDWVVHRVFEYGTLGEIFDIIDLYGSDQVSEILKSSSHLKPVTKAMGRLFLDLDVR